MKVLFVASGNHGDITPVVKNQGDSLISLGVDVSYFPLVGRGIRGYCKNIRKLRKCIKAESFDIVHAHYSLTAFVATFAGVKNLVVSLMGGDVNDRSWYKLIIQCFAFFGRWQAIIVKSVHMYDALGIKRAKVLPNGVDMNRFKPIRQQECQQKLGWNKECVHILFPADKDRVEKDYPLALKAIEGLKKQYDKHIELHSFENVPNQETPIWYNAADVVLLTSIEEGSPNVIKEAMACNRPIVVTPVGDVHERLNGVEGCYVSPTHNKEDIVKGLTQVLSFSHTNGRDKIIRDGLSIELIAQQLIRIYQFITL